MQTLLRKIGFEVEFASVSNPLRSIEQDLSAQGERVYNAGYYRHSNGTTWDLKTDSSCGYEIASPVITTYDHLVKAAKVVEVIKRHGGFVNEKCGLHVHIDMNHIDAATFERVMRFMSRYENAFFLLADQTRQSNQYCRKLDGQPARIKRGADFRTTWTNKHYWLNGTHLGGQGTLEFRLMASHLQAEYIVGWVLFLVHTVDYLIKGKKVAWGKATCKSDRDLLQTMLGQAGFYGPFDNRDKDTIVVARKWAIGAYTTKVGQTDTRVKAPTLNQFEALVETPAAPATSPVRRRRRTTPTIETVAA